MATPMFEQGLTLEGVLELSADELRDELAGRDIDVKGMSKVDMQKTFIKILFPVVPVAPVVAQQVSPRTALSPQQLMELEVMNLKLESEEREKRLRFESEALERKERKETEALERQEAIEKQERAEALEKKERQEAIEKQERAEALEKKERQEAIEKQERAEALEKRERREE